MISAVFFAFLGLASLYAFVSGRHALGLILAVGFSQDVIRKLTPGEPVIFIVTVGVLFGAILLGVWLRRGIMFSFEPFTRWTTSIQTPLIVFLTVLLLQLIHSFLRYNNLIVGLIGLITYIAPFLAMIIGYSLANSVEDIRKFMRIYAACGIVVAISVGISFLGFDWTVLKEVGAGLKIYDQGTVLRSYAGFMRTGEVAAWHASTAACMILAIAVSSKKPTNLLWVFVIIAALMLAVAFTGRRKMLMLASLFVFLYFFVYLYYRKTLDAKYFLGIFYSIVAIWLGLELISLDGYSDALRSYIARSTSVFGDASGRFLDAGINPVQWAYRRVGVFGGGLGIASQGSYLFNVSNIAGGSGEGGLGKIMVELGLPGLVCIIWLVWSVTGFVNSGLKLASQPFVDRSVLPLMVSLVVFLGVNALTFSVATQVYGDIFILILLGLFGGFIFALPKVVMNSIRQQQIAHDMILRPQSLAGA